MVIKLSEIKFKGRRTSCFGEFYEAQIFILFFSNQACVFRFLIK